MRAVIRSILATVFFIGLAGCVTRQCEVSNSTEAPAKADWTPPIKSDETTLLSPQKSKALLATLAFVYEQNRAAHLAEPQIFSTQCKQQIDGSYEVRIFYVGYWDDHVPGPRMGGFTVFDLDKDWKIVRSSGGA